MIEILLSKILVFFFFMSSINILRHVWKVYVRLKENELSTKYELPNREFIFLIIAVSYFLTVIFTGVKL